MRLTRATATKGLVVAALLVAAPGGIRAQSTQQLIDSAKTLYEAFNVEAARPILLRIISPGYLQQVTSEQKATAFKYLGASYAVLATPGDSAKNFFQAALDFDPFTDLDPTKFAASELAAFNDAKNSLFKIGIRPLERSYLMIPTSTADSAAYTFRLITTQRGQLHVEIVNADSSVREVMFDGISDGLRPIQWRGLLSTGGRIREGVYQLRATARDTKGQTLTEALGFRIEPVFEPLEDSLPPLDTLRRCQDACDLLPERIPGFAPWSDLIKGGVLAGVAVGLPAVALGKTQGQVGWTLHAAAASGIGAVVGGASFWYRRRNPEIPQNVAENQRRKQVRARFNAAVKQRNEARTAATMLILHPISAGLGR